MADNKTPRRRPRSAIVKALQCLEKGACVYKPASCRPTLNGPKAVWRYCKKDFGKFDREVFSVLILNAQNRVIAEKVVSIGTVNASLVHPREVFKAAVVCNAASMILVHNHPSGEMNPSQEDIGLTRRLKKAGELLGIEILDHVVIATKGFYSFKEHSAL